MWGPVFITAAEAHVSSATLPAARTNTIRKEYCVVQSGIVNIRPTDGSLTNFQTTQIHQALSQTIPRVNCIVRSLEAQLWRDLLISGINQANIRTNFFLP